MEYYVGLDVSLRSCALCIVDGKGVMLFERELPCDVNEIADCLSFHIRLNVLALRLVL